jgi:Nif-specific regulatory protein
MTAQLIVTRGIREVLEKARHVAPYRTTVLITGETGTGKEVIAQAIHHDERNPRRHKPFVAVNCGAFPEGLLESELFGHEKGAFTGAVAQHRGKFEQAQGGTLFLDEIGSLSLNGQNKLLRALEERVIDRVGGAGPALPVDVRIVAAGLSDLPELLAKGQFRKDLFYRLNVFPLFLPPLRQRRDDIPALAESFVSRFAREMGKPVHGLTSAALQRLLSYAWPGNIRELRSVIERAVVLAAGPLIGVEHLSGLEPCPAEATHEQGDYNRKVGTYEARLVADALRRSNRNKARAARLLGLPENTLRTKIVSLRRDGFLSQEGEPREPLVVG